MKPEIASKKMLSITQAKAKMYEYAVPQKDHIIILEDPAKLFLLTIGILGDVAYRYAATEAYEINDSEKQLNELRFSAKCFNNYFESKLNNKLDRYLLLLGASAFYLCEMQGNSLVLAKKIQQEFNESIEGLEQLILWLLKNDYKNMPSLSLERNNDSLLSIYENVAAYFKDGEEIRIKKAISIANQLREHIYAHDDPRQLFLIDLFIALLKKKYTNSCWRTLPEYSGLPQKKWVDIIRKENFIYELWPAQHLLGRNKVLQGESAVIQMPTSAGKTKSTELIIRSAFLRQKTKLAVVVAPFKSLCHELRDNFNQAFDGEDIAITEVSDVLQLGDPIFDTPNQIIIITPEKLLYLLRLNSELSGSIGLIIFDEGHQFDNGSRGITYELLLTSLKLLLSQNTQKILISAVISNAKAIGEWLIGENSVVISDKDLIPTTKSIGFANWRNPIGQINFVNSSNIDNDEFYVPRVIESVSLEKRPRERTVRLFPEKSKPNTVALFLGLKLVSNGSVAIFCGNKKTLGVISKKALDIYQRRYSVPAPIEFSVKDEVTRIYQLLSENIGEESTVTKAAELGIFVHHAQIPDGVRLAVEAAMRNNQIKFVICTSTLAQGVNLPIKYLIITSVNQAGEKIKTRDFHNLIGRVSRAGIHTEGSILFAETDYYDKNKDWTSNRKWDEIRNLMNPDNSEDCTSNLLLILKPLILSKKGHSGKIEVDISEDIYQSLEDPSLRDTLPREVEEYIKMGYKTRGVTYKIKQELLSAVQSFILSFIAERDTFEEAFIEKLASSTLAYHIAEQEDKDKIKKLFKLIATNITNVTATTKQRSAYSKTLLGINQAKEIEKWVEMNLVNLLSATNSSDLLKILWPILSKYIDNNLFKKCTNPEALYKLADNWIGGTPFYKLYSQLKDSYVFCQQGKKKPKEYSVEEVVGICEQAFAYEASLIMGAVIQFVQEYSEADDTSILCQTRFLQKKLKYGLPYSEAICLYEMGFSDRVIALESAKIIGVFEGNKEAAVAKLKQHQVELQAMLERFPSYYQKMLEKYL